jgi:hypothetical protein
MWGIVGAILAVPMLAVINIVYDRIEPLASLAILSKGDGAPEFLGGSPPGIEPKVALSLRGLLVEAEPSGW